jgi:hypothetical protein
MEICGKYCGATIEPTKLISLKHPRFTVCRLNDSDWRTYVPIDPNKLQDAIRDAAKRAFTGIRRDHSGETFYAYALYTDDDFVTLSPSCNSEEALSRKIKKDKIKSRLHLAGARWGTAEWAYEAEGDEHFAVVHKALNPPQIGTTADERSMIVDAVVGALRELDSTGFFGEGAEREKVTLFMSISDSEDTVRLEDKTAKLLNPPAVSKRFVQRFK